MPQLSTHQTGVKHTKEMCLTAQSRAPIKVLLPSADQAWRIFLGDNGLVLHTKTCPPPFIMETYRNYDVPQIGLPNIIRSYQEGCFQICFTQPTTTVAIIPDPTNSRSVTPE
jgi:hypothetical protein